MMFKNENIDKKVTVYIENLFSGVGASQQLFDLKEELATNLREKTADIKSRGMDDDQAFKEAVISMGDLSGLIDDMRKLGQDTAKQNVYSSMTSRLSTAGIVAGVLLMLFGILTVSMLYFMELEAQAVTGSGIFVVAGGALFTYSLLNRETTKKYAMNKIRAALYALSIGLLLFSIFVSVTSYFATGEMFIAIGSLMVFLMGGIGLFLILILTGTDRRKNL
ncbi:MAG: permease prefix domain 1-containing protein [Syntrophomonas sp.]